MKKKKNKKIKCPVCDIDLKAEDNGVCPSCKVGVPRGPEGFTGRSLDEKRPLGPYTFADWSIFKK